MSFTMVSSGTYQPSPSLPEESQRVQRTETLFEKSPFSSGAIHDFHLLSMPNHDFHMKVGVSH